MEKDLVASKTAMKIGFQTIVWGPRYRNLKYMLDVIAAAGYQGVQFFQPPKVLGTIDRVLRLLEERKLKLIGLSGGSLAERMAFCGGFRPEYLYLDSWDRDVCLKAMIEGFTLGLHPHAYMPIRRLADAEKLLREYPDEKYPQLKLVPDTAHLTVTHDNIFEAIRANINRIVAVHLKDWSPEFGRSSHRYARGFTELGDGSVDLDGVLHLLEEIGYNGWIIVEQDYTVTDPLTNTLRSAGWLAKRKLLPKPPCDMKSEAGLAIHANRQICSRRREVLFLRSIRRIPLQDIDSWYATIARAFQRLVPCKLIEVWTCSPAQDAMSLVAISPDPKMSIRTFIRKRHVVLSGDTMEHKAITHFDLTDAETVKRSEHPELVSKLGINRMVSIPVFNPWNFNHVRLIVNLFPYDDEVVLNDDELFRFGEYVAFTLDSALEDMCSYSAAKVNFIASKCRKVQDFLDLFVNLIKTVINCEGVAIFLVNKSGNKLELGATTGTKWNVPQNERFYKKEEGLTGWVWESKETLISENATLEPKCERRSFETVRFAEKDACLFVPLTKPTGEVVGVLRCRNKSVRRYLGESEIFSFSDDEAAVVESIAQAAIPHLGALMAQVERERALANMRMSLHVLGHETQQLNFGLEQLRMRYLSDVRRLKNLEEHRARIICRDIEGYFRQLDFLFTQARMIVMDLPEPTKEDFWIYQELLFKWEDVYRLEAEHKNLEFDIWHPWESDPLRPRVYGDKMLLEQLIYNLVSNAVKYSYQGTKIRIDCKKSGHKKNSPHILSVINYGNEFMCDNPYEMSKRGDNVQGIDGVGIGLYNAKRVADAHKASLRYECEKVSDFNVPLIEPYLSSKSDAIDISLLELLRKERERMKRTEELDNIVARSDLGLRLYQPEEDELIDLINRSTWRVTIYLAIPAKGSVK